MQFPNQKPLDVASEVLAVMERYLSEGRSYLEITAGVHIACKLFALPSALRPETQVETESSSAQQESVSAA
jgi:hypothetical protein